LCIMILFYFCKINSYKKIWSLPELKNLIRVKFTLSVSLYLLFPLQIVSIILPEINFFWIMESIRVSFFSTLGVLQVNNKKHMHLSTELCCYIIVSFKKTRWIKKEVEEDEVTSLIPCILLQCFSSME